MVAYATHTVYDGKWQVTVWRKYQPGVELPPDTPDLRDVISKYYSATPAELAQIVMEQVLDCHRVHVQLLSGAGIYAEKITAEYTPD